MRYFLQLSFNGKNYHGWQLQANAHSVQAELNTALSTLLKADIETLGCGRTDTGVHAKKFFAHFDTLSTIEDKDFIYHLNCLLPFEIAAQQLYPVADDAHARYDATGRTYRYYIHKVKNPFLNETSYFFPHKIDLELMNEAAELLLQYKNFGCFSKSRTQVKTDICNVTSAVWSRREGESEKVRKWDDGCPSPVHFHTFSLAQFHSFLFFEITADRFLRNMVRAIVGTLLDVGEKHITIDDFKNIIEKGSRSNAGVSVPAHGLFLENVVYPFIK
jgi:tRNA pseudouridine38-40 synthase